MSICVYVRTYVRLSTKSFFDFDEILHVGRGRWLTHDGMQLTWSKVKITSPWKLEIRPFSKAIWLRQFSNADTDWRQNTWLTTVWQSLPLLSSNICGSLAPGHHSYQGQGPRWGWGVSWSQAQSSETVYQPLCELLLTFARYLKAHLFGWPAACLRTINDALYKSTRHHHSSGVSRVKRSTLLLLKAYQSFIMLPTSSVTRNVTVWHPSSDCLSHPFLGRLLWVDLIKWVSNVRPPVCTHIHPSICTYVRPSTKSFFDFYDIWCVGKGRWVMHDSMQYDPIEGQGHEPLKVENSAIFKGYLFPPFIMGSGKWPRILKLRHNTYSLSGPDFWFLS